MSGNAQGGDDTLISGRTDDDMWGDAEAMDDSAQGGCDTFVFGPHNGNDTIYDFEQGMDLIDLSEVRLLERPGHIPLWQLSCRAFAALHNNPKAISGFDLLDTNANGVLDDDDAYVSVGAENTVIDLGAAVGGAVEQDTVTLVGQTALTSADFIA